MLRASDRYVPLPSVHAARHEDGTVLTATSTGERCALNTTGAEVWTLLHAKRRTVDRLVMALARRSSGQALANVPDLVREQLDALVSRGFVTRVADA